MPRDVSSSSSSSSSSGSSSSSSGEDEGPGTETHAAPQPADSESTTSTRTIQSTSSTRTSQSTSSTRTSQSSKFQCPADFVSFSYKPSSTLKARSSSELWLIKAPASFDPQCFAGVQLPLNGLSSLDIPHTDGGELAYTVLSSSRRCSELRLLSHSKKTPSHTSLCPPFTGLISINQSFTADCNQALRTIPAVPPPALPPGLKQRFHYTATSVGSKRKREKRIKNEPSESTVREAGTQCRVKTEVKVEPLELQNTQTQQDHMSSKKKKKKKSKSNTDE